MAIGSENARRQKSVVFLRFLMDFGFLEASLGSYLASWSRLGAVLGPSWAVLGPSWGRLGASLGLSWALLGDLK